ncbi:MAG: hypothetical protein JWP84_3996 [Tardiphaga sp.]|nr:hypothetical protein [Tardiphaga sp.]
MSGVEEPASLRIVALRGQIAESGAAIRQRQASMDNATAWLLLSRKRAELGGLLQRRAGAE